MTSAIDIARKLHDTFGRIPDKETIALALELKDQVMLENAASGWIDIMPLPTIEHKQEVWFANGSGVWRGLWDRFELHKGHGMAYPKHVMVIGIPSPPKGCTSVDTLKKALANSDDGSVAIDEWLYPLKPKDKI